MATVSSIVVRQRLATMRQVEEALARQTLYGGDVVTNLLDVAPPPQTNEAALTAALAEATGLAAAPLEKLREPDSAAVSRVGRNLAEHHGFVPIAIRDGAIVLALAEPLSEGAIEELVVAFGAKVVQEVAPTVRLKQAMERAYGVPMDRRSRRLASLLDGGDPEAASVPAPRRSLIPDVPDDPMAGQSRPSLRPIVSAPTPTPPVVETGSRPPPPTTIRSDRSEQLKAGTDALQGLVRSVAPAGRSSRDSGTPSARRRKGPFTRTDAQKVFAEAPSRDAVLSAVLEFTQQWFAYVAVFLVHDDLAEGWEAAGSGPVGERVRKMGVPLDLPSIFSSVRASRAPVVRARAADGLDAVIAADLERPPGGDVLVAPVVVGSRVVAFVYGDDEGSPIVTPEVSEVFAVIAEAGAALARIILRKKQGKARLPLPKVDPHPHREVEREVVAERAGILTKALVQGRIDEAKRASTRPPPPEAKATETPEAKPSNTPETGVPRVRTATFNPIVSPTSPVSAEVEAARAATPTPLITRSWENPPLIRTEGDSPTGLRFETVSHDAMPAIRDLESRSLPELVLPRVDEPVDDVADALPTPLVNLRPQPSPAASAGPASGAAPGVVKAPPPGLLGKRSLGPVIPREEPEADASDEDAPTPLAPSAAGRTEDWTDTSAPELIESAEVDDDELMEVLEAERAAANKRPSRPSERFEVYAAREPPRPTMRMIERELPKVMVAIEPELVSLVAKVIRGGAAGEKAAEELRELGVAALPAIMDRFPGPTRVDRTTAIANVPPPSEAGPLLGLLVGLERLALRDVLARTGDPLPETRFWATWLLTEIVDPESAAVLVPRLVDDDLAVRRAAWAAGRALLDVEPATADLLIEPLIGVILDPGGGVSLRIRSANALGELRDKRAVEGLIFGLEAREPELASACHDALITITRIDPVALGETWNSWLSQHGSQSRIEWLIDALLSDDAGLREAASTELKSITKVYVGYYANLPRVEREDAWRRYRNWWKEEGRRKFERAN